ncbi:MAG: hypothetical protein LQ343_000798 [Gyalolechia ehrenbergii]|nr:MAG: hypothetical protein LQ343_000798 [Gyalolechia ehrenbergii]
MLLAVCFGFFFPVFAFAIPFHRFHHKIEAVKQSSPHSHGPPKAKEVKRTDHPILRATFTSNPTCGAMISCNAGRYSNYTGVGGIGAAAVNSMLFGGPPGVHDGSGGYSNVNGVGPSCGTCWTLTPGYNYNESNGMSLGQTVVKINDACADAGYCDQSVERPFNTGPLSDVQSSGIFKAEVHFDLCQATGVAQAFFGQIESGVAIGAAQYNPVCSGLTDGEFGGSRGIKLPMPF